MSQVRSDARLVSWRRESVRRSRGPPILVSKDIADSVEALQKTDTLVALPRRTVLWFRRGQASPALDLTDESTRYWELCHRLPTWIIQAKNWTRVLTGLGKLRRMAMALSSGDTAQVFIPRAL